MGWLWPVHGFGCEHAGSVCNPSGFGEHREAMQPRLGRGAVVQLWRCSLASTGQCRSRGREGGRPAWVANGVDRCGACRTLAGWLLPFTVCRPIDADPGKFPKGTSELPAPSMADARLCRSQPCERPANAGDLADGKPCALPIGCPTSSTPPPGRTAALQRRSTAHARCRSLKWH